MIISPHIHADTFLHISCHDVMFMRHVHVVDFKKIFHCYIVLLLCSLVIVMIFLFSVTNSISREFKSMKYLLIYLNVRQY